jgi:crotonobetainyl-CoA:carnitine CoA-transferase CaiB-like acyl-CoA transferase
MPSGALEGIRVLELGEGVSAPFCVKLFADYGADVIKVEPPGGDITRGWGPFPADRPHPEKSGLFFFLNTNKRGVTLDVATKKDRERFLKLVTWADVFVENNPPPRMRQWGLDYGTLSRLNPDLVMISITPFGQTGPYAEWKAYDLNAYHLTAGGSRYCGRPGEPPLEHGTFSAEFFGAYTAATWGLAAVHGRARAGGGQHIDVSCAEAIAALFVGCQNIGAYAQEGVFERRTGIGMALGAPATILPAKDGHVWMMALEPGQWDGLRRAMGDPEWARLEMFQDMFVRAQNAEAIYPLIEQWTREHTKQEIMDLCQANGCPTTALFTVGEVARHHHLEERGYFVNVDHPVLGTVRTMNAPIRLPESPGGPRRAAPLLGGHNAEVLDIIEAIEVSDSSKPKLARDLPLEGVRVANFGWGWLGPVVGQTLGFLGAEVYKIESRARVDINRTLPPFGGGLRHPDRSLQNHAGWAGNGSVTINLKKPEGQELARQLVAHCDVAVENFGPGVMKRLHLGYEEFRALKSDIILVSIPAAGLFGPLKDIRTYGMSLSSITGLDSLTGYADGPPIPVENAFADPLGGVTGALAVLLALRCHVRTGKGQHVDCSQQEGLLQLVAPAYMDYVLNGRVAGPMSNRHPLGAAAPHGVFPCAGDDRWISIAVFTDDEWQGLVAAMGHPNWAREFAETARRIQNIDVLHERLSRWTHDFGDYELAKQLQQRGVAATPVLNVADLLNDAHYKARGTFIEVTHPLGFAETIYGAYVKTSGAQPRVTPGPVMGRDNDHVFLELMGISEARYRALVEAEIVF